MIRLTINNYEEKLRELALNPDNFPDTLKEGHELVLELTQEDYEADSDIREVVDLYFEKLLEWRQASSSQARKRPVLKMNRKTPENKKRKAAFKVGDRVRHKAGREGTIREINQNGSESTYIIEWDKTPMIKEVIRDTKVLTLITSGNQKQKINPVAKPKREPKPKVTKQKPKPKPVKPKRETKASPKPKPKPKPKTVKKHPEGKMDYLQEGMSIIRQACNLHPKNDGEKAKAVPYETFVSLLTRANKLIAERRVNKDTLHGKTLLAVATQSASILEILDAKNERSYELNALTPGGREAIELLLENNTPFLHTAFAKKIAGLFRNPTKEKAERLLKQIVNKQDWIAKEENKPGYQNFKKLLQQLVDYIEKGEFKHKAIPLSGIVSGEDLLKRQYDEIGLTGKWKTLLGDMTRGASVMIKGREKMGKSTLAMNLAKYLSSKGNVLYVSAEEWNSPTLQRRIAQTGTSGIDFTGSIPPNLTGYDFMFVDSFAKAGLSTEFIQQVKTKFPDLVFYIFRTTKSGEARGTAENAFEVDAIIDVENGEATCRGRFGGGRVRLF